MSLGDRIALISIVVLSLIMASLASSYIRGNAIEAQDDAVAHGDDATKTDRQAGRPGGTVADARRQGRTARRPDARVESNDDTREKTLAVLIMMFRDGRGLR
jgi:hypothetical protein